MTNELVEILRSHSQPMEPVPTDATPKLASLGSIRAVMFDIYGTLLVSGSGDVGTVAAAPGEAFLSACAAMGLHLKASGDDGAKQLVESIKSFHDESHRQGIEYPEVDILAVWRRTLAELHRRQWLGEETEDVHVERLAIEYELRANPVWTMPGMKHCMDRLVRANLHLGIISNAQFFTPMLFPALLQEELPNLGFSANLCFYSYEFGRAKPDTYLFERAAESLQSLGLSTGEVLYIGNDMLNDVMPAQTVGFKTALFAGDRRSLRLREGDTRVTGVEPNIVITKLGQLVDALGIEN